MRGVNHLERITARDANSTKDVRFGAVRDIRDFAIDAGLCLLK
jgi:hypothetical protein